MKAKLFFVSTTVIVLLAIQILLLPQIAYAATCVSSQSGIWHTASNWDCGHPPTSGDDVVISATHTITMTPGASVRSLTINPGGTLNSLTNTLTITNSGAFTNNTGGAFNAGTGTVSFTGAGTVAGSVTFNDITVAGGVDFDSGFTVNGTLQIDSGGSIITNVPTYGSSSTLLYNTGGVYATANEWTPGVSSGPGVPQNVQINNTTLNLGSANRTATGNLTINGSSTLTATTGNLDIGGNLANSNVFNHNNGTVTFNGSGAQNISGISTFYNLTINNQAATPNDTTDVNPTAAITVDNTLTVDDGQFQPLNGSSFQDIIINNNGILRPDNAATLTVSSNWTNNNGSFDRNNGTVTFNGAGTQTFSGSATFNHVTVNGGNTLQLASNANFGYAGTFTLSGAFNATSNSPTTVTIAGTTPLPAGATTLRNLTINSGASLTAPAGTLNIAGNWTNNGAFSHNNGAVTFNGTAAQAINNSTTNFNNLIIDNSTGVTLNSNIGINNTLTINAGRVFNGGSGSRILTFANGSSFTNNGGIFNRGNSTVLFTGTGTVTGIVGFHNVTLQGAVDFGTSSTVNGTLQIDSGGLVNTNVPTYGNISTLQYNTGGTLIAATEWISNTTSDPGVPQNVRISGNTTLDLDGTNRTIRDNLTIDSGSTLSSTTSNLNIGGDWNNNGDFNHNNGAVTFNGLGAQAINDPTTFNLLTIDAALPGLTLNSEITVSNTLTISPGKVFNGGSQTLIMLDGSAFENVGGTFNAGSSAVRFDGAGTITSTGMITYNNVTLNGAGGVDFGTNSVVDGTLLINNIGGFVDTNPPTYSSSSTLQYNTGGIYPAATEWISSTTSDPGAPQNVRISGSATLDLDGSNLTQRGNLTIDGGSVLSSTTGNLNIGGDWTNNGAFNHNNGLVTFNGLGAQVIGGSAAPVFYNLTISNTAAIPSDSVAVDPTAAISVTNMLTVNDGQFQPDTGSSFNHITINSNGILKPDSGAGITVSGNWVNNSDNFTHNNGIVFFNGATTISGSNDLSFNHAVISNTNVLTGHNLNMSIAGNLTNNGTYNHNNGTVTFNGWGAQTLTGSFTFYNLTVDNTAAGPSDTVDVDPVSAVAVENNLIVNDGQFQPYINSIFKNVTVNSNGFLKPDGFGGGAGIIFVSGNWTNNGAFIHNNGTVFFNGTTTISGTVATTFYNLNLTNNANVDTNTAVTVAELLRIIQGQFQPSTGSSFKHVDIFSNGTMTPKNGAVFSVSGNWSILGAFNSNNSNIIFNGTTLQSVSGQATIFNSLAISNAAGVALGAGVTVTSTLALSNGVLSNNATDNIILNDGATILRIAGSMAATPQFGTTVNVEYTGSTGVNSGYELPISSATLNNLTINNSGGITLTQNITVNGAFALNAGTFNVDTKSLTLKGLVSATGGSLTSTAAGTVIYDQQGDGQNVLLSNYGHLTFSAFKKMLPASGVVTIAGTFNSSCSATGHSISGSTIEFNGAGPQTLPSCFNPYHNLTLNNPTGVIGFAGLTVNNLFNLKSGAGTLTGSGTYNYVRIDSGATMVVSASNAISISGNLTNHGSFSPDGSTVIFNGSTTISGVNPISFNNVTIAYTAQLTGPSLNMNVAGNFINNGVYNHNNGSVTFNGTTTQSLTANANTTFNNLTVISGAILSETVTTDNAFVAGTFSNNGLIRKSKPVLLGTNTFGLTGITLTVTTLGLLADIQVDRTGANHPNGPSALQTGQYWRFTPTGIGYTVNLALPHTITDDSDAAVCHYSDSGTTWDCARNLSNANTVTRTMINQLLSDWAVGNYDLADLEVVKKVNNAELTRVNKDELITYTITVINHDPSPVSGVKVIDLLPISVTFASSGTTHGSYDDNNGQWNFFPADILYGGEIAVLTIAATVNITVKTPITNTAQITAADQTDGNSSNNQDNAIIIGGSVIYLPVIMKNS